jgi:hypothetical protein
MTDWAGSGASHRGAAGPTAIELAREHVRSAWYSWRFGGDFASIHTYAMFIGHARAGGSLLGALLDAHPNAVVADEVDVIGLMRHGRSRDTILARLVAVSRQQTRWRHTKPGFGRTLPYPVVGQSQGRFDELQVAGSTRAGLTTRTLAATPELLERWADLLGGVRLRFIQVVRNPYDAVSSWYERSGRPLANGTEMYASNAVATSRILPAIPRADVLRVRYEDLVADPRTTIADVCAHLGLPVPTEFLDATSAVVSPAVINRTEAPWSATEIAAMARVIDRFPFLRGYRYDAARVMPGRRR